MNSGFDSRTTSLDGRNSTKNGSTYLASILTALKYRFGGGRSAAPRNLPTETVSQFKAFNLSPSLAGNQDMLRAVLESTPNMVSCKDLEGRYLGCNRVFLEARGHEDYRDIIGKTIFDIARDPDEAALDSSGDKAVLETGRPVSTEERIHLPDGSRICVLCNRVPTVAPDGGVTGLITIATDITDLKTAECRRRECEQKYRDLTEGSIQGVFIHKDSRPLFANQRAAAMFGFKSPEEILEMDSIISLVAPEDRKRIADYAEKRSKDEEVPDHYEMRVVHKDSTIFWVEHRVRIVDWAGERAVQSTIIDISEQKRSEAALSEARDSLEQKIQKRTEALLDEVAERKAAEAKHRAAEEKYRQLVDCMLDGVFLVRDEKLLFVNEGLARMVGYAVEQMTGRPFIEFISEKDRPEALKQHRKQAAEQKAVASYEFDLLKKDGKTLVPVLANVVRITASDGKEASLGTLKDVSDLKNAETALRENSELLHAFIDNADSTINLKDDRGRILMVNNQYAKLRGVNKAELIGKCAGDIIDDKELVETLEAMDAKIIETKKPLSYEIKINIGGVVQTRVVNKFPIFDSNGQVIRIGTIGTDISEQKKAEDALRESERKLRAILEHAPISFAVRDIEGRLCMVNREFSARNDFTEEEALGKRYSDYLPKEAASLVEKSEREVIRTGKAQILENAIESSDASASKYFQLTKFPMFDDNGNVTMVGTFGIDITERKETENALIKARDEMEVRVFERTHALEQEIFERKYAQAELIKANEELETRVLERTKHLEDEVAERKRFEAQLIQAQKMEAVGQMAGGIAHDFNNLLTVVLANLGWLKEFTEENPKASRMTNLALEGARRAGELTQRMLAFSRRQDLQPETIDLIRKLDGVKPLISRALGETISFDMSIDEDLWPVSVDTSQLESSILNIAINARDAMVTGGKFTLTAKNRPAKAGSDLTIANESGDSVEIRLTDTGCGIPSDTLKRVFDPFFTTKEVGRGSGLGLSMVFGFAKQSGGFVEIDSEVGSGTSVRLVLPRAEKEITNNVIKKEEPEAVQTDGMRVLVVEDDEMVRNVTVEYLKMAGINVSSAENADFALAALHDHGPVDLVISDVIMPGTSGVELASELKKKWPETRVVLMTGYSYDEFTRRGIDPKSMRLLRKPFSRNELLETINEAMQ